VAVKDYKRGKIISLKRKNPLVAVRAIIVNEDDKILLLKRSKNCAFGELWCLPGGTIDFGFTAEEAIIKEVKEETALICGSVHFLFYQNSLPYISHEDHYLNLYFSCKVNGKIKLNKESSDFKLIRLSEIDKYDIAFKNDEAIRKYWQDQEIDT
jgi:mutator protein MutT